MLVLMALFHSFCFATRMSQDPAAAAAAVLGADTGRGTTGEAIFILIPLD